MRQDKEAGYVLVVVAALLIVLPTRIPTARLTFVFLLHRLFQQLPCGIDLPADLSSND